LSPIVTRCCIAGGGPAGMMLGLLLARAGIDVVVLEKHADFLRDFRGDTVHPSTLELMRELGLLEDFLKLPHQEVSRLTFQVGAERIPMVDFSTVPTHCKFVALMPQWDFLNFIASQGKRYPAFHLRMQTEATDLIIENDVVKGLRAKAPGGGIEIRCDLVVGCDGRHSTVRERAELIVDDIGAPIDVLWFRLSRRDTDTDESTGHLEAGQMMVMLNRGDYWQCAYVIPKGGIERVKHEGLPAFKERVLALSPFLRDRIEEIASFDDVKLLTVAIDRLREWHRPGLLCIGDAAHAMSPVGGVGINLAVQDAVAAANILAEPLRSGTVTREHLGAVQARRAFPTRVIQRMQVIVQDRLLSPALLGTAQPKPPFVMRLIRWFPLLRRIPARIVGVGVRPEHIHTPDVGVTQSAG
jgi:2-polyprenyl-6-methoxyphenol hydroxylase-like FAD-dependent oxidoreductase